MSTVLVTGCLGFIGSHFVKYVLNNTDFHVIGFNRNSDQKNLLRIGDVLSNCRFRLVFGDLVSVDNISGICEDVEYVVNFAAKTFVDHSIRDAKPFIDSNVIGTYNLLEEIRKNKNRVKKLVQVSTDEVYGSILEGAYREDARLYPTNPYSASKAAADMLCISYYNTYNIPVIITRTENNFGEYQHRQKAIPTFIRHALENRKLPVYGDGEHKRMWLYVEEHCSAILHLMERGQDGEIYHIAGEQELTNNQLAKKILRILGKDEDLIEYINDYNIRPGHDRRYALNTEKIRKTGWNPKYKLDDKLKEVVLWYVENQWWLN